MLNLIILAILVSLVILSIRTLKYPGIAAALVWAMITLESVIMQGSSFLSGNAKLVNYAVGGLAAAAAVWAILNNKYKGKKIPRQVWLYALLTGFCLLSVVWSISPDDTIERRNKNLPYILAFGFLAPMCMFDEKQLRAAIKTTIYFGALIVLANLLSEYGRRGIVIGYESDGTPIEANPLAAASYAGYVGLGALFSIWGKRIVTAKSFVMVGIILACLAVMVKSGSRGQLIAFFLVAMFWLPVMTQTASKRSIVITLLAFVGALALVFATVMLVNEMGWARRWDLDDLINDNTGRLNNGLAVVEAVLKAGPIYWIVGLGTSSSFKILDGTYPHNIYFEVIAEEGLVGIILFCSIVFMSLRQGFSMMKSKQLSMTMRQDMAIIMAIYSFNLILAAKQGSLLGSSSSVFCLALTIAWIHSRQPRQVMMPYRPLPAHPQYMQPRHG